MSEISNFPIADLYTWSVVHVAPKGWNVPYIAGYVDLPESVRVFAHIVGVDAVDLEMDTVVTLTTVVGADENGTVESHSPRRRGRGANMREVSVIGVGMIPLLNIGKKR